MDEAPTSPATPPAGADMPREIDRGSHSVSHAVHLSEVDQFKSTFISTAAHALNTPLTPIQVQLHVLKERLQAPGTDPAAREALEMVQRNFDRLEDLVHDIVESARVQAERFEVSTRPAEIDDLLCEAVASLRPAAQARGIRLRVDRALQARVLCDPEATQRVVANLVGNALRFTPRGGSVTVEAKERAGAAHVHVRDTGVGIRKEDLGRLFHAFTQLGASPEGHVGAGLGLYISRGLVEAQGGEIWAESEGPDRGSTFSFSVPLEHPADARTTRWVTQPSSSIDQVGG